MFEILKAVLFGVVEGITEWLPVSSTGHMILLDEFVKMNVSPEFWDTFLVVIQLGAILAVVLLYWGEIWPLKRVIVEGKHATNPQKAIRLDKGVLNLWGKTIVACLPAAFSAARFAPRSPQSLAASFRGAKSSQRFRAAICLRRPFPRRDLLPAPRKALRHRSGEQNLHRNSAPSHAFGRHFRGAICSPFPARPCATVSGSKIFTEIPRRHLPPATPVGAVPPAKPYTTVGPRQQGAPNSARRPTMLAPPRRQSHISPSSHANRAPRIPPGGRPCWRRPSGKTIYHRRATPTGHPKSRLAADHVGAVPPAKPYIAVGSRQQGAQNPARRPTMLAPPRRQNHISPSGPANRAPRL